MFFVNFYMNTWKIKKIFKIKNSNKKNKNTDKSIKIKLMKIRWKINQI